MGDLSYSNQNAMDFGTAVHKACHLWNCGTLNETTLDPWLVPHLDQYRRFIRDTGSKVVESERHHHDATQDYCGTIDNWICINGRLGVLDIKTGQSCDWHSIQTAAYLLLHEQKTHTLQIHKLYGRWALYLDGTEKPAKLVSHTELRDYYDWMAVLAVVRRIEKGH
jgi:hypothetical protein